MIVIKNELLEDLANLTNSKMNKEINFEDVIMELTDNLNSIVYSKSDTNIKLTSFYSKSDNSKFKKNDIQKLLYNIVSNSISSIDELNEIEKEVVINKIVDLDEFSVLKYIYNTDNNLISNKLENNELETIPVEKEKYKIIDLDQLDVDSKNVFKIKDNFIFISDESRDEFFSKIIDSIFIVTINDKYYIFDKNSIKTKLLQTPDYIKAFTPLKINNEINKTLASDIFEKYYGAIFNSADTLLKYFNLIVTELTSRYKKNVITYITYYSSFNSNSFYIEDNVLYINTFEKSVDYTKQMNNNIYSTNDFPNINLLLTHIFSEEYIDLAYFYTHSLLVGKRHEFVPVLMTNPGIGKGTYNELLKRILSINMIAEESNFNLNNDKNGYLRNKVLFNLNELKKKNFRELFNYIKDQTGKETIQIRMLYQEAVTIKNVTNYMISTNETSFETQLDKGERRFIVIDRKNTESLYNKHLLPNNISWNDFINLCVSEIEMFFSYVHNNYNSTDDIKFRKTINKYFELYKEDDNSDKFFKVISNGFKYFIKGNKEKDFEQMIEFINICVSTSEYKNHLSINDFINIYTRPAFNNKIYKAIFGEWDDQNKCSSFSNFDIIKQNFSNFAYCFKKETTVIDFIEYKNSKIELLEHRNCKLHPSRNIIVLKDYLENIKYSKHYDNRHKYLTKMYKKYVEDNTNV